MDRGIITYNGSESWTKASGSGTEGQGFWLALNSMRRAGDYRGVLVCDKLQTFLSNVNGDYIASTSGITGYKDSGSGNWIYAKANNISALADFKTWLSNNTITVVYPLATPTTVQLTAQQLTTLLGQNNVFADAGDVDVTYVADTKLYIAKMIANALNS